MKYNNLNYILLFQFLVIKKSCLRRRISNETSRKGREFYTILLFIFDGFH